MLALTKWRVQIKDIHFQRLSLKVLIFLAFTKNDFFFLPNFQKSLELEKMMAKFLDKKDDMDQRSLEKENRGRGSCQVAEHRKIIQQ